MGSSLKYTCTVNVTPQTKKRLDDIQKFFSNGFKTKIPMGDVVEYILDKQKQLAKLSKDLNNVAHKLTLAIEHA